MTKIIELTDEIPGAHFTVRRLDDVSPAERIGLTNLLIDVVHGGASVSFMHPLSESAALNFWSGVADGVRRDVRALWVAEDDSGIVGTVQLVFDVPENQPHRADLAKMLVMNRARRRGIGAALLLAAEAGARESGRWLLVLDTASGDAERLYERLGWQAVGVIPDYALLPYGGLCDTRVYFKRLERPCQALGCTAVPGARFPHDGIVDIDHPHRVDRAESSIASGATARSIGFAGQSVDRTKSHQARSLDGGS